MQYFQPKPGFFVGDCMPFYHEGTFHFIYLLDEGHHQGLGGMGGHQWAHASSRDLINWEHHPLAVAIDKPWEKSICTGSVFFYAGIYHAFYAVRKADWSQHLGHAVSRDCVHFEKREKAESDLVPAPAGIMRNDFRDPFVFADEAGLFHQLVTAQSEKFPLHDRGGCLLHRVSADLAHWKVDPEPFFVPGGKWAYDSIPECPDYFFWNGWYYLLFGSSLRTHYRMSRDPMGPWTRPRHDQLGSSRNAVMKTAPFGHDRRIGAAWLGCRKDDKDNGEMTWGGHALFREIVQDPDGTLGTKFPQEMIPATGPQLQPAFHALTQGARGNGQAVEIAAPYGQEVGYFGDLPQNLRLRCTITPGPETRYFGLGLRGSDDYGPHYDLRFELATGKVSLSSENVQVGFDWNRPRQLDVIVNGDIIDVCLDGRETLVNRCPELKGDRLFFYCEDGNVKLDQIDLRPLLPV